MEQQQGQHIAQHIMERLLLLHVSGLLGPGTRIISPFTQNVNMFIGIWANLSASAENPACGPVKFMEYSR